MTALLTPVAVTKLLLGVHSPAFPAVDWYKSQYWKACEGWKFEEVLRLAQSVRLEDAL
jgi:hypothetical protein